MLRILQAPGPVAAMLELRLLVAAALFPVLFGALVVAVAAAATVDAVVVAGGGQVFGLFVVLLVPASLFPGAPVLLFPVVLFVLRLVLELQPLLGVDELAVAEVILP